MGGGEAGDNIGRFLLLLLSPFLYFLLFFMFANFFLSVSDLSVMPILLFLHSLVLPTVRATLCIQRYDPSLLYQVINAFYLPYLQPLFQLYQQIPFFLVTVGLHHSLAPQPSALIFVLLLLMDFFFLLFFIWYHSLS